MTKVVMVRTIVENWVYNLILRSMLNVPATQNFPGAVSRLSHCTLPNSNIQDNTGIYWKIKGKDEEPWEPKLNGYGNSNITGLPDEIHAFLGKDLRGGSDTLDMPYIIGEYNAPLSTELNKHYQKAEKVAEYLFKNGQHSALGLDPRIKSLQEAKQAFAALLRDSSRSQHDSNGSHPDYDTYTDDEMLELKLTYIAFDMQIAGFVPQNYIYKRISKSTGIFVNPKQGGLAYNYY